MAEKYEKKNPPFLATWDLFFEGQGKNPNLYFV